MFLVVFRSSQKRKKRWFTHGEKKSRTTNLDFPSVLLNQGLTTEANNNTRGRKLPLPFFTNKEEEKREKGERKREEKRQLTLLRARHDAPVCSSTHSATKQQRRERALHTTRETTRVYKNTITNDEIVTTPEENKHRSLFETSAKREGGKRSLKSARDLDLDVPIDRIEEV
jgi:hypothetical protein